MTTAQLDFHLLKTISSHIHGEIPLSFVAKGIATNINDVKEGFIYLPLDLENENNGITDHLMKAKEHGAVASFIKKDLITSSLSHNLPLFEVEDYTSTIEQLAKEYVDEIDPTVVAIVGKNSSFTKDLLAHILKTNYAVHKSDHLSKYEDLHVCLSALKMERHANVFISEYDLNSIHHITKLSHLFPPNYGIITEIGKREKLSEEEVRAAYISLESGMRATASLVLDADDEFLVHHHEWKVDVVTSGSTKHCLFQIDTLKENGEELHFSLKGVYMPFEVPITWKPYLKCVIHAIAISVHLGLLAEEIYDSLKSFQFK
ncbi:Mur ligase family protein [Evansella cellulosilytica]|uniref:Mur ligase central domain-containing protein n=1 Tax=Evansella cellulosilytica (strain ATCC 21833 / DSM 2522 / FERM P-1141 / JCM 9156 / N-4) TaxID=649639 RepID=E6TTT3_EVAC2|nr:Mur ligase family protein [Evansella cellulosilytica]ADU30852.1 hypothetical protein Bcell_2595 [Evansella cellulosilytica DSM 2522]